GGGGGTRTIGSRPLQDHLEPVRRHENPCLDAAAHGIDGYVLEAARGAATAVEIDPAPEGPTLDGMRVPHDHDVTQSVRDPLPGLAVPGAEWSRQGTAGRVVGSFEKIGDPRKPQPPHAAD